MSPSATEAPQPSLATGARAWAGRLGRSLRRTCGGVSPGTLYLHPEGVWAWPAAARDALNPEPDRHENVDAWCAVHEGCDADVVVSGHLVHSLLVDAALPLGDAAALQTYARHQFTHYHGAAAQDWPLAPWSVGAQRGACALHALDLGAVRLRCAAHGVHLRSLRPAWSVVLPLASRQAPGLASDASTALAVVDGGLVTWLRIEFGQVRALQQRFAASNSAADISQLLGQLQAESAPLGTPPVIVGWGVAAPVEGSAWPGQPLGRLDGRAPAAQWLMATRRAGST